MTKADSDRARVAQRIKDGICAKCGKQPADTTRSARNCTACLDAAAARDRARGKHKESSPRVTSEAKIEARENGFCIVHTSKKLDGKSKSHCKACCRRRADTQARYREKRGVKSSGRRAHRFKVTLHDGNYRARSGKVAMWGKTEEEAVERLRRKLGLIA